jgi:hypothetical protein
MVKQLQVILTDLEYREIQQAARCRKMSIAEWVRRALVQACRREALGDVEKKLAVIRVATQYEFPTGDIETMLAEIEQGYLSDRSGDGGRKNIGHD